MQKAFMFVFYIFDSVITSTTSIGQAWLALGSDSKLFYDPFWSCPLWSTEAGPPSSRLQPPAEQSHDSSPSSSPSPGGEDKNVASLLLILEPTKRRNNPITVISSFFASFCHGFCLDEGQIVQDRCRIGGRELRKQLIFQATQHHLRR